MSEPTNEPALRVEHIAAGYGDLCVVWDLDLEVRRGAVTLLLGRNGAGKTTSLHCIAGLVDTYSGSITLEDRRLDRLSAHARARHGLALVQEGKRVFRQLTVAQNLLLGGHAAGRRVRDAERLAAAYERFPVLAEKANSRAGDLSGGQQQMLATAQALASKPSVVMLDEPSAGLAPVMIDKMVEVVSELAREGLGVLVVEQVVDVMLPVADTVSILEQGRTISSGPRSSFSRDELQDVYLGS